MKPELVAFCREDTRDQVVGALAEAVALQLNPPTPAERRLREIAALRILARGNVSQRAEAKFYAERMKGER